MLQSPKIPVLVSYLLVALLCLIDLATLKSQTYTAAPQNLLEQLVNDHPEWGAWTQKPSEFQAQVILTEIKRDEKGQPSFTTHRWGHGDGEYYYPASTVKMPVAVLALQWLNETGIVGLDANSRMQTGRGRAPQTVSIVDATAEKGWPSVAHFVRKIFLVSDNDAYNRLYELLGQRYINEQLRQRGLENTRIIHRLSVSGFDTLGNRYLNPVGFYHEDSLLYYQGERYAKWYDELGLSGQQRGVGYIDDNDALVNEPFDFSYKNYVSLLDQQGILMRIMTPEAFAPEQRFNLTAADYELLHHAMGQRPRESEYPAYPDKEDHYVKFWQFGDRDTSFRMPDHLRIYNKVGWAYGYLTDVAYVKDTKANVEYFISGTIHVNENRIYNDGKYEYDAVGLPFFGQLGRAVHEVLTGG